MIVDTCPKCGSSNLDIHNETDIDEDTGETITCDDLR